MRRVVLAALLLLGLPACRAQASFCDTVRAMSANERSEAHTEKEVRAQVALQLRLIDAFEARAPSEVAADARTVAGIARAFARAMLDQGDPFAAAGDADHMREVAVAGQHVHDWTAAHCPVAFDNQPLEPPPSFP